MKKYKVAILGATGAVGREMMKVLAERDFPAEELHLLASKLMRMIDPNAGETRIGGGAQSVQAAQPAVTLPTDAVSEIQKYKALLDAGVLTEEEFSAKKRQLLGI